MKFTEIQVQGYRSIVDVSLPLRPLAVMIGPNGSGKTALLEVFLLLNRAAWSNLAKALEGYGGLDAVLSKVPGASSSLKIGLAADVESERSQEPMHYCFELVPRGFGYEIPFERLEWRLDVTAGEPHRYIDAQYHDENLYSALYNLRALHQDVYTRVEDVLRVGFPGFERLEFPTVGAGQVTLAWYQEDLTVPLYPNQLSEGTLRFLWLTTVLLAPDPPPVILIDEPEVSLHPELVKLLAGLLQDAAARTQVIVATHSPDLVRWLQPQEVLVLDKIEGRTQFTWADTMDLGEWLEECTLRDLWLMGTLGGRP